MVGGARGVVEVGLQDGRQAAAACAVVRVLRQRATTPQRAMAAMSTVHQATRTQKHKWRNLRRRALHAVREHLNQDRNKP